MEETFYARAQDIYECFTQSGKIQAFTQSPAEAQPSVGGSFSMFGGSVQGTYKELQPFTKLTLDWRFGNWPEDCMSQVSKRLPKQCSDMHVAYANPGFVPTKLVSDLGTECPHEHLKPLVVMLISTVLCWLFKGAEAFVGEVTLCS